jgi:hypothetical protein
MDTARYDSLVLCLLNALNNMVCKVLLYGPAVGKASGQQTETSIAVLTPYKISGDQEARLSVAVFEWNQNHRETVSVIDIDQTTFTEKQAEIPFFREIADTGVVLWPQNNNSTSGTVA